MHVLFLRSRCVALCNVVFQGQIAKCHIMNPVEKGKQLAAAAAVDNHIKVNHTFFFLATYTTRIYYERKIT